MYIIHNYRRAPTLNFRSMAIYIFIWIIHNASIKFRAVLFADGANLIMTLSTFDVNIENNRNMLKLSTDINKDLKTIHIRLEIYKRSLNVKKAKFMISHYRQGNTENLIHNWN